MGSFLTKKIKDMQNEVELLKRNARSLKMLLGVSWVAIIALGVALMRST